jgi:hypothetical protein
MANHTIERRQRYRDIHPGIYGPAAASDWIVENVRSGTEGRYAHLVSASDPAVRKKLATEVLGDACHLVKEKIGQLTSMDRPTRHRSRVGPS